MFADGLLVGSRNWTGEVPFEINVWKYNREHGYPGVRVGDRLTVETWCPSTLVAQPVRASTQRGGDALYLNDDRITTLVLGDRPEAGQGSVTSLRRSSRC